MPDMLFKADFQSNALGYTLGQALRLANWKLLTLRSLAL